ncbi:MAG: SpoIIE family protein phosphatase [Phycisphaerales bacterium]
MPQSTTATVRDIALISVAGPREVSLALLPPGPMTIGRRATHDLSLPEDDHVSRDHAVLEYHADDRKGVEGGVWSIRDSSSRHGTWVNGVRITPGRACPIHPGDSVVLAPWAFEVVDRATVRQEAAQTYALIDDSAMGTIVRRIGPDAARPAERLGLLLDCAEAIQAASSERELAEAILDAAVMGASFANAAVLKSRDLSGQIGVIASRGDAFRGVGEGGSLPVSRTLVEEASLGSPALLMASGTIDVDAMSVAQLGIDEALCVPLMIGPSIGAYLYLDNRAGERRSDTRGVEREATAFAVGLGRLASLAFANLRRMELERRQATHDAEMAAAEEAQRWILPPRTGEFGGVSYEGICRPGRGIGGDFFDIIPLGEGRIGVALGDVTGKGVAASVLMTAAQGFLHSQLTEHGDPARAVAELNGFVARRQPMQRFLTLWVGVVDVRKGEIRYVDAGHGYALLRGEDGQVSRLDEGDALPVGVAPDTDTRTATIVRIRRGDGLLVVSDGVVEQPSRSDGRRDLFGMERVTDWLRQAAGGLALDGLLQDVEMHGGTTNLADDATAVILRV